MSINFDRSRPSAAAHGVMFYADRRFAFYRPTDRSDVEQRSAAVLQRLWTIVVKKL